MINLIAAVIMAMLIAAGAGFAVRKFWTDRNSSKSFVRREGYAALILGVAMIGMLATFISGLSGIASRETAAAIGIAAAATMLPGISLAVWLESLLVPNR